MQKKQSLKSQAFIAAPLSKIELASTPPISAQQSNQFHLPKVSFFSELVRSPTSIGAICASSKRLGARIAENIDFQKGGWVVELGGGTGAITRALLLHGIPASKLIVLEKSHHFAAHLRNCFPSIRVMQGDAADIDLILEGEGPVSTVVSGLPLRSLQKCKVSDITAACVRILPYSGRLVQFTYAPYGISPWAKAGLEKRASQIVWRNFPPARIEVFSRCEVCKVGVV